MPATKVLIVEDDMALAKMISSVLNLRGYEVIVTHDGGTALRIIEMEKDVDCIIQDLGLPPHPDSMEAGLETMRKILKVNPQAKILVLTGQGKTEASSQAVREGAFDFFEKPVSMDALVRGIDRALLFLGAESSLQEKGHYTIHFNSPIEEEGLKATKDVFEEQIVRRVLIETNYNIRQASDRLGLRRENLYYLLKKHQIELERHGDGA